MNLAASTVSSTYRYILNQNGPDITLGNGDQVNWESSNLMTTTGSQNIAGFKTFNGGLQASYVNINNTTAADSCLEIGGNGNVYIDLKKAYSDDYDFRVSTDGTNGFLTSKGSLTLQTNGSVDRIYIGTNGNIGLGETLPSEKLHVNGNIKANKITIGSSDLEVVGSAPTFGARAFVSFNGEKSTAGVNALNTTDRLINASGNISSVNRMKVGNYKINFTKPMASAQYAVVWGGTSHGVYNGSWANSFNVSDKTTTSFTVQFVGDAPKGTHNDQPTVDLVVFC